MRLLGVKPGIGYDQNEPIRYLTLYVISVSVSWVTPMIWRAERLPGAIGEDHPF